MKKELSFFLPVVCAILVSCSKGKEGKDKELPAKDILGRVIEIGSNNPISGADVITSSCGRYDNVFGCTSWNETHTPTGIDGKFIAPKDYRNHRIEKAGYWTYTDEPGFSCWLSNCIPQYTPMNFFISSNGTLDSMLIKLFPVTTISAHVVNSGSSSSASLVCQTPISNSYRSGNEVSLRSGIDTSFQYPVFDNAENRIFIKRSYPLNDTVSMSKKFITKGELVSINLSY